MWVALVVLIVMSLAGLAMLRQTGGGISIAGNIAFKETATSVADAGTEVARQWWLAQPTGTLEVDAAAQGYYATWGNLVDPVQIFAALTSVPVPNAGANNNAAYIIQRLCANPGPVQVPTQTCSDLEDDTGRSRGGISYNLGIPQTPLLKAYFRVTTRVQGPRNTVSYTQVILN